LIGKVPIECEGTLNAQTPHSLETSAVDQAQMSLRRGKDHGYTYCVKRQVDPLDVQDGHNILI
jgi:hypothetical protein